MTPATALPTTAAEWFAARRRPQDASFEEHFTRWLAENPRNPDEYALCQLTWDLSAAAAEGLHAEDRGRPWYRPRAITAGAAAVFIAALAMAVFWAISPKPVTFQTAAGEQRTIALADGTQLTMNTRSGIEVRLGRSKRVVRVLDGEVFFAVAKDPSRPFIVETNLAIARAVGTHFNVLAGAERVEVATEEGNVWVTTTSDRAAGVMATAGVRATLVRGSASPVLDKADLTRIENWRARRLEFDNVPLDAALQEFSRYTRLPYRAATREIGQIPVSAVLNVGDESALRVTLKAAFGLDVVERNGEWLVNASMDEPPHAHH
jgi:transmembrane sensor